MSFALHQFKKRALFLVVSSARTVAFALAVIATATLSSCYAITTGTALTTATIGPWVTWTAAGVPGTDPYTRAHFAIVGSLPLSAETARTFTAEADSEGRKLHSSCDYAIEGRAFPFHWWSISVFDDSGRLISNAAERYTFTSDTMSLKADGGFTVSLARDARPDNWLPTGGAGRLIVALNIIDLGIRAVARDDDSVERALPTIRRIKCR